ncbi:MAG TPA: peptide deformylase [Clostridia bacterium]
MAIRNIREDGDEILRKKSKEVDIINDKILTLLNDMTDTLRDAEGLGLAAPQVGILKRVIVLDDGNGLMQLINPVIVSESGEQEELEGCLSIPGRYGEVKRPMNVVVEALTPDGEKTVIEGEGLLARILCHEIDHLNGILFKDKALRLVTREELDEDYEEEEE